MKNKLLVIAAALMLPLLVNAQQTTWQTTHFNWGWSESGICQLESNKISMTVSPFYVDVVEEAVIGTRGTITYGDQNSLEITGTFTLSKGTALRSMLLWNGTKILKAKLLDRNYADSAYAAVVNRDKPRDPAIIKYLGNSTYQFRIYPAVLNSSRKIRILYSVPFILHPDGPAFEIRTAFTVGAQLTPTQVPVEIDKTSRTTGNYILSYGSTRKTIQFGSTYLFSYSDLSENTSPYSWQDSWAMNPIVITPDTSLKIMAYTTAITAGKTAGNYTAVYAAPPDIVLSACKELAETDQPTFEARVMLGTEAYITDFNDRKYLGAYLKSSQPWDSAIYWTVYNSKGKVVLLDTQKCAPNTDSLTQSLLPLIWGAKYSLVEGTDNLGALFGFVDQKMSLLALEKDTLPATEAAQWGPKGVPVLKPEEIKINPVDLPAAPEENIIFEFNTGVIKSIAGKLLAFEIAIKNHILKMTFNTFHNGAIRVVLFNMSGKVVASWDHLSLAGNSLSLNLPQHATGCMLLRVYSGKAMFQKQCVVVR